MARHGTVLTMRDATTLDAAGRLVVPKAFREAAGFVPGMPLEIFEASKVEAGPRRTQGMAPGGEAG